MRMTAMPRVCKSMVIIFVSFCAVAGSQLSRVITCITPWWDRRALKGTTLTPSPTPYQTRTLSSLFDNDMEAVRKVSLGDPAPSRQICLAGIRERQGSSAAPAVLSSFLQFCC